MSVLAPRFGFGIGLGRGYGAPTQGGGGGQVTKLQVVTNFNTPDFLATGTTSSTNNRQVIRLTRYAGGDILADLQMSLSAFHLTSGETDAAAYTARASFEIGDILVPCSWGGSDTVDIASGAVDIRSDPLQPSAFGLDYIPDQEEIFIKLERTYAIGVSPSYWFSGTIDTPEKNFMVRGASSLETQVNTPGPLLVSAGGWSSRVSSYFAPTAILGRFRKGSVGAVIVGASLEKGANDSPGDGTGSTGGYIARGFSTDRYRAYIDLAVGGQTAANYLATRAKRQEFEKYGDIALSGFGGNDFSGGGSASSAVENIRSVNSILKANGAKVAQIRMAPKSDSTDGWASVDGSNQTVRSGFIAFRDAVDAAALLDASSGLIDMTIDCTAAIETGPNTGLWKGTGVASAVTIDGTHPSSLRHGDMAVLLAPQIDALKSIAA